jgi:hypothetical protein
VSRGFLVCKLVLSWSALHVHVLTTQRDEFQKIDQFVKEGAACHQPRKMMAKRAMIGLTILGGVCGALAARDADMITSLPGWSTDLPSKQYSGYLDAGECGRQIPAVRESARDIRTWHSAEHRNKTQADTER